MTKEENEARIARLKSIVLNMPEKPGSYQYYDENGTIIYVGKAKRLKSRVSSYFHTEVDRFKTKVLVSKIHDISYTVVNTEEDALLLEIRSLRSITLDTTYCLKTARPTPAFALPKSIFLVFSARVLSIRNGERIMGHILMWLR